MKKKAFRITIRSISRKRYTRYLWRHLPVQRENVANRGLFERRWRINPPSYREMTINAWVRRHWTIQVCFHRSMATFSPFYGGRNNDRYAINVNPVNVRTKHVNIIRPTEKLHATNRARAGVSGRLRTAVRLCRFTNKNPVYEATKQLLRQLTIIVYSSGTAVVVPTSVYVVVWCIYCHIISHHMMRYYQ